jgi:low temperature requirement protein LtrA
VVIVALGESVVSVGIGAGGLPVDSSLVASAVLGLGLTACLWWSYFGGRENSAVQALEATPMRERPALGVRAYGHWHVLILLGVVSAAAALKHGTGHPFDTVDGAFALALAGGTALFLTGEALYRRTLGLTGVAPRALAAAAAFVTIPLGSQVAASAQIGALVVLLVGMLLVAED